jgi:hypothetical protein
MNEQFPLWAVPADKQHGLLVVASVLAVLSFAYAAYIARQERDPYPIFVFVGAGFAVLLEPVGDIFTQVVYPQLEQFSLFSAWGRQIPVWMAPNYLFFFCVPVLVILRKLARPAVSSRAWWLSYFGLAAAVMLFEMPGIAAASWKYYGTNGPVSFNSYPLWVAFNNAQSLFSAAVGVHVLRSIGFRGARSVFLVGFVPLVIAGAHIAASLPVATATHSNASLALVNIAAIVTIGLNILLVWAGLILVRTKYTPS